MSKAIDSNVSDFDQTVLQSQIPVLVDFWAPWCEPCRMMAPILDDLSQDLAGKVKIVKVDVENPSNQPLAMQYEVRSIPNMKLFKAGQVIEEFIGLRDKESLKHEIEQKIG